MTKSCFCIPWLLYLISSGINASHASPVRYTPPPSDRLRINIDKGWRFINRDFPAEEETHQVNQLPWQDVQLPHDWSIEGPYHQEHNTTQGFMPMNIGWYRKGFKFPDDYAGKKIYLIFDGVYRACDVWMNYAHLGHHESGYTSFAYDITDNVRTGNQIPNGLRVRVDGRRHEQDMYEGNGIYRHVWLLITNPLHITNWGTFVSTPNVSDERTTVKIETRVKNDHAIGKNCKVLTQIVDADGMVVAEISSSHQINAQQEYVFTQIVHLPRLHRWELDMPYLYKACSAVMDGDTTVDSYETPFGVRAYRFDPDRGFFLNGKHVKLRGFNAHYDFAGLGTALPDRIHWNAMTAMKQAGFNLYRSSHNPATPERLDVCDQIGMLVWDEIERKLENVETELKLVRDTIVRDRNHPSIILWSLENESPLEGTPLGTRILSAGVKLAHELDPSRPTTFAASMPVNKNGYGEAVDVVSYNYHWRRADQDHLDFPHWKIGLLSEYSAARAGRGGYGVQRFQRADDDTFFNFYSGEIKTMFEMCATVEEYWQRIEARDYLGGGCLWSGIDAWGEGGAWPFISRGDGAIDLCHFPKDVYYYFASQWTDRSMVHIFPHWNWAGKENEPIDVWCYTNCDRVELFLDNRSLGARDRPVVARSTASPRQSEESSTDIGPQHITWRLPYRPGTLRAVGMRGGQEVCAQTIHTAGKPAKIRLTRQMREFVEEERIPPLVADGRDVMVIKAAILDSNDHLIPNADSVLEFTVTGGATLAGVGNGSLISHEPNKGTRRKAHGGLCAAIVRAPNKPGDFTVTATSPDLKFGTMTVTAVAPTPVAIGAHTDLIRLRQTAAATITAAVCDRFGATITTATNRVTFRLTGPARFENGETTMTATTAHGKASIAIRGHKASGRVSVTMHCGNLVPGKIDLLVE